MGSLKRRIFFFHCADLLATVVDGDFKARYGTPSSRIVAASDASGTVFKAGKAAQQIWSNGDRVLSIMRPNHITGPTRAEHSLSGIGIPQPGVLAEYRVFPASGLVALPTYMTHDEGSTLPVAATTAWMALGWDRPIGQPRRGRKTTVLLQGTGGVCTAALQQSKALGLTGTSFDSELEAPS